MASRYKHIKNRRIRRAERAAFGQPEPYAQIAPANMQAPYEGEYMSFEALAEEIVAANVPPGWENDPWVQHRVQALVDHAYQGWIAGHEAGQVDESAIMAAQQQGYQAAMQEAERHSAAAYQRGYKQGVRAMDGATNDAYKRGYEEGLRAGRAEAKISEKDRTKIRNEVLDEVIEQGRVVEESNPNMADGVKAYNRMVRKLRKGKK